jgi:PAS domain S-box-containing protein
MSVREPTTAAAPVRDGATVPFEALLEALPVAAYICDAEGLITCFNERAAALWGRRPKLRDPIDRYCGSQALLTPFGVPVAHDACWMALTLRDRRPYEGGEIVIVRPDGSRRTAIAHTSPLHDEAGTLIGAINVIVDATEQRSAQEALAESEANFRGFFDSVAVGACQVGVDGRFIRVNDRYCEITGYSREELLSMSPFDLDHPDDRAADEERVIRFVSTPGSAYHAEKRYVRKDGSTAWVHVAANLVHDASGKPVHTVAIADDISERKLAEQTLQEADRLKDAFLATLAHELRNPLAPLRSAAELLQHPNEQQHAWCREVVGRQVTHLTRLIDDLLDVSRIASDKLEIDRQRIQLADVLHAAIEASTPMLERCGQTLSVTTPPEPLHLDGDLVRLTQVFTNLLTNAAKFSERPATVRLTTTRLGAVVRVSVEDSGIGMARDDLRRVFEKFYQVPSSSGRIFGGLGIGLSLVRRLVELHGGSVEADSPGPGFGCTFTVALPLAAAVRTADTPSVPEHRESPGGRVLIVDDNRDGADALARLLQHMGYQSATCYDGAAALERAKLFAADVILLDLGMPGMDGFETCAKLRALPLPRPPRIVALTGWGRSQDLRRTAESGFDAHLVKPVDSTALRDLLEQRGAA